MRYCAILLAAAALASAAAGCNNPTAVYDRNRDLLTRSRAQLVEGDRALSHDAFARAEGLYAGAAGDLGRAVSELETAEREVDEQLRALDRQAAPEAGDVGGAKFYADTLRGYREALALAIVLRAVALERQGEAAYREGAQRVIDGDGSYRERQFATAVRQFTEANRAFSRSIGSFTDAVGFMNEKTASADRLAAAAPPGSWSVLEPLRENVNYRLAQAPAYRGAASQRMLQAGHIVSAYRKEDVGNIPDVEILPLVPLPEVIRSGVAPPPIPSATLRK